MQLPFLSGLFCGMLIAAIGASTTGMAQSDDQGARTACLTDAQMALPGQDVDAAQSVLPEQARIIPPDSAVTQDYRPDRVNVDVDEDGVILRVWCG